MKKFITRLVLFCLPFVFILGIPTFILWKTKENFYKINTVLAGKGKYLIGYAYDDTNNGYMKWTYLHSNERKNVWALGSSRVLQFRADMFNTSFYNAGYTASRMNEFRPFLRSLPEDKLPKYIIMGLDQWMFNEAWDKLALIPEENLWATNFTLYPKPYPLYRTIYQDLFAGKYHFEALNQKDSIQKIGINALMNNTGFRNDGSLFYGAQIAKLIHKDTTVQDYGFAETFDRIKQGNKRFEYGANVNPKAVAELDRLLQYCQEKNIQVIAFLPPFPDAVYQKMMKSGRYAYMEKLYSQIKPLFTKYNFELYDMPSASSCHSNDQETIDGFHGSETMYQKCLLTMLKSGSVLNKVATVQKLEHDLAHRKNNYTVYGY